MILDKILSQGQHVEGNENDASYECYSFDFKPVSGEIVINLQTATQNKFPGNTDDDKSQNQLKKRHTMLTKLQNDLVELIGLGYDDIKYIESDNSVRKLTIKSESFQQIANYINTHPAETNLLRIGMIIVNLFRALYFFEKHRPVVVKSVLERNIDGMIFYRNDNSVEASRFPHQFYIGKVIPDTPDASVKANISDYLGQQLRDAFKVGIAKILNKNSSRDFVDTHYDEQDALSFNMSDEDFRSLIVKVGANNIISDYSKTLEHRDDRNIEEVEMKRNGLEEVSVPNIAAGEIGELNERVFDHYPFKLPLHNEKEELIKTVKEKFLAVRDIKKLSAMYKYINAEANKQVLNVHEHSIYDSIFFKSNTNSWQKLIEQIRNHALEVVFTHTFDHRVENILDRIKNKTLDLTVEDANRIKQILEPHLTDPLFCEHRSNNFFRNLFHSTSAVKKLQTVIDYCDEKIKSENAAKSSRLLRMDEV